MRYCKRCLYPENHPLGIVFDDSGVCSGCRVHEEKDALDWRGRLEKLYSICRDHKARTRTIHDCIIPVSGARDSFFIVHFVKEVLGLHPLLVSYNKQYNTELGIRNLAQLRTVFGCDFLQATVSPERIRRVTRETVKHLGSIYWHCLAGQTAYPVHMAVKLKIPLIIWGAHQGVDQVGMFSHLDEVEMTRKYRKDHDLMGMEAEDLLKKSRNLNEADMEQFFYPHDKELEAVGVRGIYLNNYVRWDSKAQHEQMIHGFQYQTSTQQRTFDTYNDVDCWHYSGLHDYIKYLKHGYGKVVDHASREIRLKRLTREHAIELVAKYQPVQPNDTRVLLDWLGMSDEEFWQYIDLHRSPSIWEKEESGAFTLRDTVLNHGTDDQVEKVRLDTVENCEFMLTPETHEQERDGYTLIGRGWYD